MPQQLIYTSSPRLLTAGRSGFGTVVRSATMREGLVLALEQLSYFEQRALTGGRNRVICACRMLEIRGARYHVLTRLVDAGLDFTNRTNFLAHHLVLLPEEISTLPLPSDILTDWSGWKNAWTGEPEMLTNENWQHLHSLKQKCHVPAITWLSITGNSKNALAMLETGGGTLLSADDLDEPTVLSLLSETLAMLEVCDPSSDFPAGAWRYTFTTSLQEQDDGAHFRWRFVHSDAAAFHRLSASGQPLVQPKQLHPKSFTAEAAAFASRGYQPPVITRSPQDSRIQEGQTAFLQVDAEGVPLPRYFQWYRCGRYGNPEQEIGNQYGPELRLENLAQGIHRFCVVVANSRGDRVTSPVAKVEVERVSRVAATVTRAKHSASHDPSPVRKASKAQAWTADAEDMARFLENVRSNKRKKSFLISALVLAALLLLASGGWLWHITEASRQLKEAVDRREFQQTEALLSKLQKRETWFITPGAARTQIQAARRFVDEQKETKSNFVKAFSSMTNTLTTKDLASIESQFQKVSDLFATLAPDYAKQHKEPVEEFKTAWEKLKTDRAQYFKTNLAAALQEKKELHQKRSKIRGILDDMSQSPWLTNVSGVVQQINEAETFLKTNSMLTLQEEKRKEVSPAQKDKQ